MLRSRALVGLVEHDDVRRKKTAEHDRGDESQRNHGGSFFLRMVGRTEGRLFSHHCSRGNAMSERDPDQPRRRRLLAGFACAGFAVLSLASCAEREPQASITDLNWACGTARCTATFRVTAGKSEDENLLVLVRAYAGEKVASREIVGEHKERLGLRAGQSRRLSVAVETRRPADRVRIIVRHAD